MSVAVVLVALGMVRYLQTRSAERALGTVRTSIAALQTGVSGYRSVAVREQAVLTDQQLAEPLVSHEINWPSILALLASDTPSSVSASDFDGSSATATAVGATAMTTGSGAPPVQEIATISLSLSGQSYPAFQAWFSAMTKSRAFEILQYSGVSSASTSVQFTAELGVTSSVRSDRIARFKEDK